MEQKTSPTLLRRLQDPKDHAAWTRFDAIYRPMIEGWSLKRGLQAQRASEVAQEVLVRMWRRIQTGFVYDPTKGEGSKQGKFRAYLKTLTRHAWVDYQQDQKRAPQMAGDPNWLATIEDPNAGPELSGFLEGELLAKAKEEATARDWQAFALRDLDGKSTEDVASLMGISPDSVLVSVSRVRKIIRRLADPPAE